MPAPKKPKEAPQRLAIEDTRGPERAKKEKNMLAIEDKKDPEPPPKRTALENEARRKKEVDDEVNKLERAFAKPKAPEKKAKPAPKAPDHQVIVKVKGTSKETKPKKIKGRDPEGHEKTIAVKAPKPLAIKKKQTKPEEYAPFKGKGNRLDDEAPDPPKTKGVKQSRAFQKKRTVKSVSLVPV